MSLVKVTVVKMFGKIRRYDHAVVWQHIMLPHHQICCVFLLMFDCNGKETDARPSYICLLPYDTDVTDGGTHLVDVIYGVCHWVIAVDQSAFFEVSVLTCILT